MDYLPRNLLGNTDLDVADKASDETTWSDTGKAVAAGVGDVGSMAFAAGRYVNEKVGDEDSAAVNAIREQDASDWAESWKDSMSPAAQKAAGASVTSGDFWQHPFRSAGLKFSRTVPSMVAAGVSGALLAPVVGATAGAAVAGGALSAGDFLQGIDQHIDGLDDKTLQEQSSYYLGQRMRGVEPDEAKANLKSYMAGPGRVLVNATLGALGEALGVGGMGARAVTGGAALVGAAEKSMAGRVLHAGAEGGFGEMLDEGTNNVTTQNAEMDAGLQKGGFDWDNFWGQTLEGGLVGTVGGAPFGIAGGHDKAPAKKTVTQVDPLGPDPAQGAALDANAPATPDPVTPEVTPDPGAAAPPAGPAAPAVDPNATPGAPAGPAPSAPAAPQPSPIEAATQAIPPAGSAAPGPSAPPEAAPPAPVAPAPVTPEQAEILNPPYSQPDPSRPLTAEQDAYSGGRQAAAAEGPAPGQPSPVAADPLAQAPRPAPAPEAAVAPPSEETVPEKPKTFGQQIQDLTKGIRPAVLFPKGARALRGVTKPDGIRVINIKDEGQLWYDPNQITLADIKQLVAEKRLNEILNMGPTSKDKALMDIASGAKPVTVVTRGPDGTEKVAAASSSATAQTDQQVMADKAAIGDTVTLERPEAVIQERLAPEEAPAQEAAPVSAPTAKVAPGNSEVRKVELTPEEKAKYETKGRVLAPVGEAAKVADANAQALTQQVTEKVASNVAAIKAEEKAAAKAEKPRKANYTSAQKDARAKQNATVKEIVDAHPIQSGEENYISKGPKAAPARASIRQRAEAMVEAAKKAKVTIPDQVRDNVNDAMRHTPETVVLVEAKALLNAIQQGKGVTEAMTRFYTREYALRNGKMDVVLEDRRTEGDINANKPGQKGAKPNGKSDEGESSTAEAPRLDLAQVTSKTEEEEDKVQELKDGLAGTPETDAGTSESEYEQARKREEAEKKATEEKLAARRAEREAFKKPEGATEEPKKAPVVVVEKKRRVSLPPKAQSAVDKSTSKDTKVTPKVTVPATSQSKGKPRFELIEDTNVIRDTKTGEEYVDPFDMPEDAFDAYLAEGNVTDDVFEGSDEEGDIDFEDPTSFDEFWGEIEKIIDSERESGYDRENAGQDREYAGFAPGGELVPTGTTGKFKSLGRSNSGVLLKRFSKAKAGNGAFSALWPVIRSRLMRIAGNVDVYLISDASMARVQSPSALAYYHHHLGHIVMRASLLDEPGKFLSVLVHELVHAATSRYLHGWEDAMARGDKHHPGVVVMRIMKEVQDYWREQYANNPASQQAQFFNMLVNREYGKGGLYGMTNPHEALAEIMSDDDFMEVMAQTPISRSLAMYLGLADQRKTSMLKGFIEWVRKLIKLPRGASSALEGFMRVGWDLTNEAGKAKVIGQPDITPDGYMNARSAKMLTPRVTEALQPAADAKTNVFGSIRRGLDYLRTTSMVARAMRDVFRSRAGDRVAELNEMIRVEKEKDMDRPGGGAEIVRDLAKAQREAKPEDWEEMAKLMHDLTVNDVNVGPGADNSHLGQDATDGWQAKKRLPDLQRRFDNLPPELRSLILKAATYYRTQQNEQTMGVIKNVLDALGVNQPGLAEKIFQSGVDEEALKAFGGDKTGQVARQLAKARELKAVRGMYFPLMRRGGFVSYGRYNLVAPSNGRLIGNDTVEFKTRAEAQKFVEEHALRHMQTRGVWVDKNDPNVRLPKEDTDAVQVFRVTLQVRHVEFHQTEAEAIRAEQDLKTKGYLDTGRSLRHAEPSMSRGDLTTEGLSTIVRSLSQRPEFKLLTPLQQNELKHALTEASIRFLGSTRVQQRSLPRRNVLGFSNDVVLNASDYAHASSGYLARLRHMPELERQMKELKKEIDDRRYEASDQVQRREELFQQLQQRVFAVKDVQPRTMGDKITGRLLQASMLDKLAGVSFHVINSVEPWMSAAPVLTGRHGMRAIKALSSAYSQIGASKGLKAGVVDIAKAWNQDTGFTNYIDLFGQNLSADKKALLQKLYDVGLLDKEAGMELQRQADPGANILLRGMDRADLMSRQVGQAIEAINRSVVALAAYDLEMRKTGDAAKATQYAIDVVHDTMGNYSATNASPIFNHPIGRLMLQFRKFGQKLYYLLGKTARKAIQGDREAQYQFGGLMFTHAFIAGALGLPLEPIKVALIASGALGGPDWEDFEQLVRSGISSFAGEFMGEVLARGAPRALGIDVSSRMGLDSLITYSSPRSEKQADMKVWLFDTIAGAPVGLLFDMTGGVQDITQGNYLKGAAKLSPIRAGTDLIKAADGYLNGNTNARTGRQTMAPLSPMEAAAKAIGFTTASEAELREQTGYFHRNAEFQKEQRAEFTKDWISARPDERARMWGKIEAWNKTVDPKARLKRSQLDQAVRARQTETAKGKAIDGQYIGRGEKAIMDKAQSIYNART